MSTPEKPAGGERAGDLEYDLAHEQLEGAGSVTEAAHGEQEPETVYVATETSAYDGDYAYDLAHDVPGR